MGEKLVAEIPKNIETTEQLSDAVDRQLIIACVYEKSYKKTISIIEAIANSISNISFIQHGIEKVRGTRSRGSKRRVKPQMETIGQIRFGEICIEDFFTRSLQIEEIISFFSALGGSRHTTAEVYSGYISAFLYLPLYEISIPESLTIRNIRVINILDNIKRFQKWALDNFDTYHIPNLCSVLPAFHNTELVRLGMVLGHAYSISPQYIYEVVSSIQSLPEFQGYSESIYFLRLGLYKAIETYTSGFSLFREAVEASAIVENSNVGVLEHAYEIVNGRYEESFDRIITTLSRRKTIELLACDSLYLERLGIKGVAFKALQDEERIDVEIELESGHIYSLVLIKPNERSDNWVEEFAISSGFSVKRVYELSIFLEAAVLDLYDLSLLRKTKAKGPLREVRKRVFSFHNPVGILDIARVMLSRAGFVNPLYIRGNDVTVTTMDSHEELHMNGITVYGRNIIRRVDVVDPETAEVHEGYNVRYYPYAHIINDVIDPAFFPQAMTYDPALDQSGASDEEQAARDRFNALDISDEAQAIELFKIILRCSHLAAVEYIVSFWL